MADLEGAYSAKKELNRWKPKLVSPVTTAWALLAGVMWMAVAWLLVSSVTESALVGLVEEYAEPYLGFVSALALPLAVTFTFAAVVSEAVSQFRVPPPRFRVVDQLTRALGDLGLLDLDHKDRWRGMYWVAPIGRWNRKAKTFSVLFDINTVKATPEIFNQKLMEAIAGFRGVQEVSIEHWRTKRGKRRCFRLTLWYDIDSRIKTADELNPWK